MEFLESFLNCKKCNRLYENPQLIIKCGHLLCGQCLKTSKECFTCKGPIGATAVVTELRDQIEKYQANKHTKVNCEIHKQEAVQRVCLDCDNQLLCKLCETAISHQKHRIVSEEKEEFQKHFQQLQSKFQQLDQMHRLKLMERQKLLDKCQELESLTKNEEEKIKSFYESLRTMINLKEQETNTQVQHKHILQNQEIKDRLSRESQELIQPMEDFLNLVSSKSYINMSPDELYSLRFQIIQQLHQSNKLWQQVTASSNTDHQNLTSMTFSHPTIPTVMEKIESVLSSSVKLDIKKVDLPKMVQFTPDLLKFTQDFEGGLSVLKDELVPLSNGPKRYLYSFGVAPSDLENCESLFERMDLDTLQWTSFPIGVVDGLPTTKTYKSMACTSDSLYIFGGLGQEDKYFKYDLLNNTLATIGVFPEGGFGGSNISVQYDGRDHIYLFGGTDTTIDSSTYISRIDRYNIKTDKFESVGNLPESLAYINLCFDGLENIYLLGGYNQDGYYKKIQIFNINTQQLQLYKHKIAALAACYCKSNNSIYLFNNKLKFIKLDLTTGRQFTILGPAGVQLNYLGFLYMFYDSVHDEIYLLHKKSSYQFSVQTSKWDGTRTDETKSNKIDYYAIALSFQ
ncbi:Kelch repeat-containing protein [Tieghemostelium lacteum]|uniref:Kelch repeat-containing protein n=1 Tax=Tieghemostelium lacteum TaxID=361077 RepID=A0A151ZS33_TIELA|nr:Kelch repeat-containing protein [Tieghemostelium lacteum]|eukprot:KYQ96729.1 Kelch repeat-containing protein [Tieghemostelium lacteum]